MSSVSRKFHVIAMTLFHWCREYYLPFLIQVVTVNIRIEKHIQSKLVHHMPFLKVHLFKKDLRNRQFFITFKPHDVVTFYSY